MKKHFSILLILILLIPGFCFACAEADDRYDYTIGQVDSVDEILRYYAQDLYLSGCPLPDDMNLNLNIYSNGEAEVGCLPDYGMDHEEAICYIINSNSGARYIMRYWAGRPGCSYEDVEVRAYYTLNGKYLGYLMKNTTSGVMEASAYCPYAYRYENSIHAHVIDENPYSKHYIAGINYYTVPREINTVPALLLNLCKDLNLRDYPLFTDLDLTMDGWPSDTSLIVHSTFYDGDQFQYTGYVKGAYGSYEHIIRGWNGMTADGNVIQLQVYYSLDGVYLGELCYYADSDSCSVSPGCPYMPLF